MMMQSDTIQLGDISVFLFSRFAREIRTPLVFQFLMNSENLSS